MIGQAMTDGVLILLHVYFMVGEEILSSQWPRFPLKSRSQFYYPGCTRVTWSFSFFLSSERGKMNRKEMEIETLLLQNVARDL